MVAITASNTIQYSSDTEDSLYGSSWGYDQAILKTLTTITNLSVGSHTYRLVLTGYNAAIGSFATIAGTTTNVSTILSGTAMAFLVAGD